MYEFSMRLFFSMAAAGTTATKCQRRSGSASLQRRANHPSGAVLKSRASSSHSHAMRTSPLAAPYARSTSISHCNRSILHGGSMPQLRVALVHIA